MQDRHVVVLTGAGISVESGLGTFRGAGGLWEGVRVAEVATPEGWQKDPKKVLRFYNERRREVLKAEPNQAHFALHELEEMFRVTIITQNIDDLHERAGSSRIIHLHGEILKARSTKNERIVYRRTTDIDLGETCELGSQLRPHVVWFGEPVPLMEEARKVARSADFFIVVGTSLEVYPAAGLIDDVPLDSPRFCVDPDPSGLADESFHVIQAEATEGVPLIVSQLRALMA
jgi:NAD-dependent deacetylase